MPLELRAADLETCRAKLSAGSKSFAMASRLLPRTVRDPATVLYAFCREADDAVDDAPSDARRAAETQRARIERVFAGNVADDPVERSLASVVERFRMPKAPLFVLLEGFTWDAEARTYETLDDLHAYGTRVAGTVGVMMTLLMGAREAHTLARACDLGVAMQLTNIARDVGEDAARGRLYLPRVWMREAGVDPDAFLSRPEPSERVASVVARLLRAADELYARSDSGIGALPLRCRPAIRAARLIYADIGRAITRRGFDSIRSRAVVSRSRKLWLVARAIASTWRSTRPASLPAVEPARFLVAACAEVD